MSVLNVDINLSAIQHADPCATRVIRGPSKVVLFEFFEAQGKWKSANIEGPLFIYQRAAPPYTSYIILNTKMPSPYVEPLTSDLEFVSHDQLLSYRNVQDGSIRGIWFEKDSDREHIFSLIKTICSQNGRSSNGFKSKSGDASLKLLFKRADAEYSRTPVAESCSEDRSAFKSPKQQDAGGQNNTPLARRIDVGKLFGGKGAAEVSEMSEASGRPYGKAGTRSAGAAAAPASTRDASTILQQLRGDSAEARRLSTNAARSSPPVACPPAPTTPQHDSAVLRLFAAAKFTSSAPKNLPAPPATSARDDQLGPADLSRISSSTSVTMTASSAFSVNLKDVLFSDKTPLTAGNHLSAESFVPSRADAADSFARPHHSDNLNGFETVPRSPGQKVTAEALLYRHQTSSGGDSGSGSGAPLAGEAAGLNTMPTSASDLPLDAADGRSDAEPDVEVDDTVYDADMDDDGSAAAAPKADDLLLPPDAFLLPLTQTDSGDEMVAFHISDPSSAGSSVAGALSPPPLNGAGFRYGFGCGFASSQEDAFAAHAAALDPVRRAALADTDDSCASFCLSPATPATSASASNLAFSLGSASAAVAAQHNLAFKPIGSDGADSLSLGRLDGPLAPVAQLGSLRGPAVRCPHGCAAAGGSNTSGCGSLSLSASASAAAPRAAAAHAPPLPTKQQLMTTLVTLIQNDNEFMDRIYKAFVSASTGSGSLSASAPFSKDRGAMP